MNRQQRHAAILRILRDHSVGTQTELAEALRDAGHEVVQTTVSRDIHELRLSKGPAGYSLPGGDDEAEENRLHQPLQNVRVSERLIRGMEVLRSILPQHDDRDEAAAKNPHRVRQDHQEEQHHHCGHNPRHHQLLQRIDRKSVV